jgi:hypothetical protein
MKVLGREFYSGRFSFFVGANFQRLDILPRITLDWENPIAEDVIYLVFRWLSFSFSVEYFHGEYHDN